MLWVALSMTLRVGDVEPISDDAHSHTLRARDEDPSALRLSTAKHRLVELEFELGDLLVRPTAGQVFLTSIRKVGPWMGLGLLPLSGGLVLGLGGTGASWTVPLTTSQAIIYPVIGIGAFALSGLLVALFSVVSHFVDEADGAPARQLQIDGLRRERADLRELLK